MWFWILLTGLGLLLLIVNLLYVRIQFKYDLLWSGQEKRLFIVFIPIFKRFMWEKQMIAPQGAAEWLDLAVRMLKKENSSQATDKKDRKAAVNSRKRSGVSRLKIPFRDYYRLFRFSMSHTVLERFYWQSSLGLEDAMQTALGCGGIWAFKGNLMGLISHFTSLEKVELDVQPVYNATGFSSQLDSILKIRIVYIMFIICFAGYISVRGYINGFTAGKA